MRLAVTAHCTVPWSSALDHLCPECFDLNTQEAIPTLDWQCTGEQWLCDRQVHPLFNQFTRTRTSAICYNQPGQVGHKGDKMWYCIYADTTSFRLHMHAWVHTSSSPSALTVNTEYLTFRHLITPGLGRDVAPRNRNGHWKTDRSTSRCWGFAKLYTCVV